MIAQEVADHYQILQKYIGSGQLTSENAYFETNLVTLTTTIT